jgi:hypothetical protein
MVNWKDLCKPREFGGLGFTEGRAKNISLLPKWIVKIERGDQDLSCQILKKKYLGDGVFSQSDPAGASQFWKGLHKVKHWVKRGLASW